MNRPLILMLLCIASACLFAFGDRAQQFNKIASVFAAKRSSSTPIYVDPARGINKQRDASKEAVEKVKVGMSAAKDALRLLADSSGLVRDAVVNCILKDWSDEDLARLVPGLTSKSELTREGVAEIFGRKKYAAGLTALISCAIKQRHEETRVVCLWAIGEIGDAKAAKSLQKLIKKEKKSFRVKGEALRALKKCDESASKEILLKALKDKLLPVRAEAIELLMSIDSKAAVEAVSDILTNPPKDKSKYWLGNLRTRAMGVIRNASDSEVNVEAYKLLITTLIERMDDVKGRERFDLIGLLEHLGGNPDLAHAKHQWKSWWNGIKGRWTPSLIGKEKKDRGDGGTKVVRYHGTGILSERITFVIDCSGGMDRPMEEGGEGPSRLELAKEELARVLQALDKKCMVNLVYFGSRYESFSPVPVPLGKALPKLLKFNAKQEIPTKPHSNRGNLFDTLAFTATQPHSDTVFLITEGGPTEGKFQDNERFTSHLLRLQRFHGTRIHSLLIGRTGGRARSLLREIAEATTGSYHDLSQRKK